MALLAEYSSEELFQAQLQLWHQALCFFKPVALSVVLDLRIPDAIHRLGGAATLPQIMAEAGINPCKLRDLRRIMRVLTLSGIFSVKQAVYKLTTASRLLVRDESLTTTRPAAVSFSVPAAHAHTLPRIPGEQGPTRVVPAGSAAAGGSVPVRPGAQRHDDELGKSGA